MTKLVAALKKQLEKNLDVPIIKDQDHEKWYSGQDMLDDVKKLRHQFAISKVQKGDHILICLDNTVVYTGLEQAIWETGAIAHLVSAKLPLSELQQKFNDQDYVMLIARDELANQIVNDAVLERIDINLKSKTSLPIFIDKRRLKNRGQNEVFLPEEDDIGLVLETSGTTGKPKQVGLTHEMLFNAAMHNIEAQEINQTDTTMIVMPMFHINAQVISTLSTRLAGGKLVIVSQFSASNFWRQISENQITWVSVVPTIISILLINQKALDSFRTLQDKIKLRFVRCASFALPENKLIDFKETYHAQIIQGYGMTETASVITLNPFDKVKVGSAGKAIGTEIAILVDGNLQTKDTQVGEIVVKGDHVIHNHFGKQTDDFYDDWLMTGDIGSIDKEGYLFIEGRSKEMINHGGEKIAPAMIESTLSELEFVDDVVVIGLPDDLYGETVTAVVKTNTFEISEFMQIKLIFEYAKKRLAKFEQPTRVFFVKDFPRNSTGKVIRNELRQKLMLTV